MKRKLNILLLGVGAVAVFFAGFICGILMQVTPRTASPLMQREARDILRTMGPELFGPDFMHSMQLVGAGKYRGGRGQPFTINFTSDK